MKNNFDIFSIFKEEVKGHLQQIIHELLQVEKNQDTEEALKKIMRYCHTIKGAARAVNLIKIKELAHIWEEIFWQLQKEQRNLSTSDFEQVLSAVNELQNILQETSFNEFEASSVVLEIIEKMRKVSSGETIADVKTPLMQENLSKKEDDSPTKIEKKELTEALLVQENFSKKEDNSLVVENFVVQNDNSKNPHFIQVSYEFLDNMQQYSSEIRVIQQATTDIVQQFNRSMDNVLKLGAQISELSYCEKKVEVDQMAKKLRDSYKIVHEKFDEGIKKLEHMASQIHNTSNMLDEQVLHARLKTLNEVFELLPLMVRNLAIEYDKEVEIKIHGEDVKIDSAILDSIRAPLTQLLRNAIAHGIELPSERVAKGKSKIGQVGVYARNQNGKICIDVKDDGHGIDHENIRKKIIERGDHPFETAKELSEEELLAFLFLPGFTTSNTVTTLSGRGIGLDIVKSEVENIGGSVAVATEKDKYSMFTLAFPVRISLTPVLLVVGGQHPIFGKQIFAIPHHQLESVHVIEEENILLKKATQVVEIENTLIPVTSLSHLFSLASYSQNNVKKIIFLKNNTLKAALIVEEVLQQENIIIKPIDNKIGTFQDIQGISTLANGKNILVLDTSDLVQTIIETTNNNHIVKVENSNEEVSSLLLVVEDSMTVRELIKRILIKNDYQVITAIDGQDGLNKFEQNKIDVVITDIDMPRLNGFEMIENIRNARRNPNVPVIILSYKEEPEHRNIASKLKVREYLTKADFNHGRLLDVLKSLAKRKR